MSDEYVSLKPSDAIHGGGMVPEGRYKILEAKFTLWDYNGTQPNAVPALGVEYKGTDDSTYTQYYSAGDIKNLTPSEDGKRLRKVGSSGGLNDGTNLFQFLHALVNANFPEDKLGNDITLLMGLDVDIMHEATKERQIGNKKMEKKALAVVAKIHNLQAMGVAVASKGAPASKAKGANGSQAAVDSALEPAAANALVIALKAAPDKTLDKKTLATAVFNQLPADANRSPILQILIQDAFLGSLVERGVFYDAANGSIVYAGA
jgi:hypothetical protein